MGVNKQKIVMLVLAVLLILSLSYIATDKYITAKQRKELTIYQTGAQAGYATAINQIIQQASTCQQIPLYFNNQTINIVAVNCLQGK